MNISENKHEETAFKKKLGFILLSLALLGLVWIVTVTLQLWNAPNTVPFVSIFIELLEENAAPIIKSAEGAELNLPASWPVIVGIFLAIVLISSIGLLVRVLLVNGLMLLFPEMHRKKDQKMANSEASNMNDKVNENVNN